MIEGIKETEKKLIYDIDFNYIKKMAERMAERNKAGKELSAW
jgi:hypothetical protein